jgi:midasin (ATPase involved in ribosome maturation)
MWTLHSNYPVLITGGESCGKTSCVFGLAHMSGVSTRQVNITPETEPSLLIGQHMSGETGIVLVGHPFDLFPRKNSVA